MKPKIKILIVEDDDTGRELLRLSLERHGYEVFTASNGLSGYETALHELPQVIITDVAMPIADGAQLLRRVRDTGELNETPVIVTTGYGTGHATFVLTLGADAFEPKPVNIDNLLLTIKRVLKPKS